MKVATAEPNVTLRLTHAGVAHVFAFGEDGTLEIDDAQAAALRRYSGPLDVRVTTGKRKTKKGDADA